MQLPNVRGVAARAQLAGGTVLVRAAGDAELGRQGHFVATVGEQLGDELLVLSSAVHVGGVDEGDTEVDAVVQGGQRFGVVDVAIHRGQCHRSETQCADRQFVAESDMLRHAESPSVTWAVGVSDGGVDLGGPRFVHGGFTSP